MTKDPKNHRYTPAIGLPELREAIAIKTKADSGTEITMPKWLSPTVASRLFTKPLQCLLDPGDEVILPSPYWTTYPEAIALAGGKAVEVLQADDQNYMVTVERLEKARTPKTKAMLLCSPSNPTGSVYSKEQIKAIVRVGTS